MLTVIVVEDEAPFRETVCDYLSLRGFRAVGVGSEQALEAALAENSSPIVVLDVNLGRESGFAIARRLRGHHPHLGIVMLTARSATDDHVTGLDAGADCYLTKPVDLRVLEATISGLSRRLHLPNGTSEPADSTAGWSLDDTAWQLSAPNGRSAPLTANEMTFLAMLAARTGVTVGRAAIAAALGWRLDEQTDSRIASLVNRLRRKVEQDTGFPLPVRATRTVGYAFIGPLTQPRTAAGCDPGSSRDDAKDV